MRVVESPRAPSPATTQALHLLGTPVSPPIIFLSLQFKGRLADWLGTGRMQSHGEQIPMELTKFGLNAL